MKYLSFCSVITLGFSMLLGCVHDERRQSASEAVSKSSTSSDARAKKVAEAGDMQVIGLGPTLIGGKISFSLPLGSGWSRVIETGFTTKFTGPMTTNAIPVPDELIGRRFEPGTVRLEFSLLADESTLAKGSASYVNANTLVFSKTSPNVLDLGTFKKVE